MTPPPPPAVCSGLVVIGWKELVDFPEWGLRRIRAKVDTGACTSALDATRYEFVAEGNRKIVRLHLALDRRRPERIILVDAPLVRLTRVRNSGGGREERPVVEALLAVGPVRKRIELTVTNRAAMRFPILLGRAALAGDFLVDVARAHLLRRSGTR
jgi:hypothetical protein